MQNNFSGFTLIELIIVLAIIAILSAIAYPLYNQHIVKTRRSHALVMLNNIAADMEQYYNSHHSYIGADISNDDKFYQFTLEAATDSSYQIAAVPQGTQARQDSKCATLKLNNLGEQTITGGGTIAECW